MSHKCLSLEYIVKSIKPRSLETWFKIRNDTNVLNFILTIEHENISAYNIVEIDIEDYFNKLNISLGYAVKYFEETKDSRSGFAKDIEENMRLASLPKTVFPFFKAVCNVRSLEEFMDLNDNSLVYVMHKLGFKKILVVLLEEDLQQLKKKEGLANNLSFCALELLETSTR